MTVPSPGRRCVLALLLTLTAPAARALEASRLGINISWPNDYAPERPYADLIKLARSQNQPWTNTPSTSQDADGWPNRDVDLGVVFGLDRLHGTYALSFEGQATVGLHLIKGSIANQRYDRRTNVTTATITIPASEASTPTLVLTFRQTRKTPASATDTGVAKVRLMRPQVPGGATPFPSGRLFSFRNADGSWTSYAQLLRRFEVLRTMDFTATNSNQQVAWADRVLPSAWSISTDTPLNAFREKPRGAPWEHVVLFANEIFPDAATRERAIWINVPVLASDDYILQLARLFRYGSDGVTAYTSTQARPVYPPLDPGIKLYVEYSNELWNAGFSQWRANHDAALAEAAAYPRRLGPLSYDREPVAPGDPWGFEYRRQARRTVEISNIFRSVFGDAAMTRRIRPVIGTQAVNRGSAQWPLLWIFNFYGNGDGKHWGPGGDFAPGGAFASTVGRWAAPPDGQPHPPSYYVYGAGGTTYFNPTDTTTTTAVLTSGLMGDLGAWKRETQRWAAQYTKALGLEHVAYEGGPSYDAGTPTELSASQIKRPAVPNQTDVLIDHQRAFDGMGGDLNVLYVVGGDRRWSFLPFTGVGGRPDVFNLDSAKIAAVDEILASARTPIGYGHAIPSTATAFDLGWTTGNYTLTGEIEALNGKTRYLGYLFRADADLRGSTVTVSKGGAGTIQVYVDGAPVASGDGGTTWRGGPLARGIHGIIVKAESGRSVVRSVAVEPR